VRRTRLWGWGGVGGVGCSVGGVWSFGVFGPRDRNGVSGGAQEDEQVSRGGPWNSTLGDPPPQGGPKAAGWGVGVELCWGGVLGSPGAAGTAHRVVCLLWGVLVVWCVVGTPPPPKGPGGGRGGARTGRLLWVWGVLCVFGAWGGGVLGKGPVVWALGVGPGGASGQGLAPVNCRWVGEGLLGCVGWWGGGLWGGGVGALGAALSW